MAEAQSYRRPLLAQFATDPPGHQLFDVIDEDVEGPSCGALGELRGEFDTLSFAARKLSRGLAQLDVAQAYLLQSVQISVNLRHVLKEFQSFMDGHVQNFVDVFIFIFDLQSLAVVAPAVADLAGHVNVRQEVHLDLDDAVSRAGLAAAALDVKAESALLVAAHLSLGKSCKKVADRIEHACIGGRVRTRSLTDGALVDVDYFIYVFQAVDPVVITGFLLEAVGHVGRAFIEDLVDEG